MKKSRRVILVSLAVVAASAAVWWHTRRAFETTALADLPRCESRAGVGPVAYWPERGLDVKIEKLCDRGTGATWSFEGEPLPTPRDLFLFSDSREKGRRIFVTSRLGERHQDRRWTLALDVPYSPYGPMSARLLDGRFPNCEFIVPNDVEVCGGTFQTFDESHAKRVAYFSFYGKGEQNGATYNGPGFASRIPLFGDVPKWVEVGLSRDYDGYTVWIVPELSDGSQAAMNTLASRQLVVTKETRRRVLTTEFGRRRVVGWHVYAAPTYKFQMSGFMVRQPEGAGTAVKHRLP